MAFGIDFRNRKKKKKEKTAAAKFVKSEEINTEQKSY